MGCCCSIHVGDTYAYFSTQKRGGCDVRQGHP
jgi:hypothetical protein